MVWPIYAALLSLLFVALSIRTLRLRRRLSVSLGDGGHSSMLRAIRAHGNFAEYVPLGLLLIAGAETLDAPALVVHGCGIALLTGRVLHAFGLSRGPEVFAFRVSGMALTFTAYLGAAVFVLLEVATGG